MIESPIPKHLRFTWGLLGEDASEIPAFQRGILGQWRALHPAWEIDVFNRERIEEVARAYPDVPYLSLERDIQRCDACRPMLLHRFGGVYADLDVEPLRTLEELLLRCPHAQVLVGVEIELSKAEAQRIGEKHKIRNQTPEVPQRIANYFMASVPGHSFWKDVMELIAERSRLQVHEPYDVLFTTGPDVITEVIHRKASDYDDVEIVSQAVLDRFIRHHQKGSWRTF